MMADHLTTVVLISVIFMMLGVGLKTALQEVLDVARRVGLVARGVLANFVVVPVLVCLGLIWLPLGPEVKLGILLMAAAPVAPMVPPFVDMAKGDVAYSVGLMIIVALLSVFLTPLILGLAIPESVGTVELNPLEIVKTLLVAQLIPIGLGMTIRSQSVRWSERLLKFVPKVGQYGLIVGVGLIVVSQATQYLSMSLLAHLLIPLCVLAFLFIGEWILVGETMTRRRALAVATAIRNVPLAFLIAGQNFPGTVVAPVTLLMGTYTMIFSIAYARLRDRRGTASSR
ncbi:MAG: bile acid:sodium symporter family protein [Planctomycetota bacterium]|jgi:BASS family bile acid:Na+ symporter